MSMEQVSKIVLINGLAIIAGSILNFLASNGSVHPTNFAIIIIPINERKITADSLKSLYITRILRLFVKDSIRLTTMDILNSLNATLK